MQVFGYTAPFAVSYPEYVNVTYHENGSTILTVRELGCPVGSRINLPPEQARALGKALLELHPEE